MIRNIKIGLIVITPLCTLLLNICYYSIFYFFIYRKLGILLSEVVFWSGFICATINVVACYLCAEYKSKQKYTEKEKNVLCLVLSIINTIIHVAGSCVVGDIFEWSAMENYGIYYCMINIWILILMCIIIFFNFVRYIVMNVCEAKNKR